YTVYGKYPEERLRGRTSNPKKMWRGHDVDANLKETWLERLNDLPVDVRSTDEGKDETRVAFVIFRLPEDKEHLRDKLIENLNREDALYVHSDIGQGGRPRICVAYPTWKGKDGWKEWWETLPEKIGRAYKNSLD
ncbi:MAG: hypothetical protein ACLFTH_00725, partial [Candidatus Woesearchaeota archaeon]